MSQWEKKQTKQASNFQHLFLVALFLGTSLMREKKNKILSVLLERRTQNKLLHFKKLSNCSLDHIGSSYIYENQSINETIELHARFWNKLKIVREPSQKNHYSALLV